MRSSFSTEPAAHRTAAGERGMTADTASGAELDLPDISPAAAGWTLRQLLPDWLSSDLRLREGTADEIRARDRQHRELLRRHGLASVVAFYDEELLSAAARLPEGNERWRLWFEVGCRAVALHAAAGADREATGRAVRLLAALPRAHFAAEPKADRATRRQVRGFLAARLSAAAERLRRAHQGDAALRAYQALDRLGAATPFERAAHARLLWHRNDHSREALRVYLRALEGNGSGPLPPEVHRFVEDRLAVGDDLPPHEIQDRLALNQLALCSPHPPRPAWRNAGIAYLRLDAPARALPYLERATAADGSDHGASAFYLGQARFRTADYAGSAAAFEDATRHGYPKVRIDAWRGLAYARLAQWERALAVFREAAAEAGEVPAHELYLNWGRACFVMGEFDEALRRFTQAAADQTDPRAAYGQALCHEALGERASATAALREVCERHPEFAPAAHRLGLLLEAAGDLAGAAALLRRAVDLAPWDAEYQLALGLALCRSDPAAAVESLEAAATAGAGGPEVVRRLVLICLERGDRPRARRWLTALAAAEPTATAAGPLRARDLASLATEAFNAGRYGEAAAFWEEAARAGLGEAAVAAPLALALAHDAAARLRTGETEGVAEAAARAVRLAPEDPDCRLLAGVARLLDGQFAVAAELLRGLAAEPAGHARPALLGAVATLLAGEGAAAEELPDQAADLPHGPLASLAGLLGVVAAAAQGRFEEAGARCDAWLADPQAASGLGLPQGLLNRLVAAVKLCATGQKRRHAVRSLEALAAGEATGYWAPAVVLARHQLATEKGLARAGEANPEDLAACREAYRTLLERLRGAPPEVRQEFEDLEARLLLFMACHDALRGRLAAAAGLLGELADRPRPPAAGVHELADVLRRRLERPSHESAWALLEDDPEAARRIWEALLAADSGDLVARHHLACLAWSRAYDAVVAGRVEESLHFWRDGLEHFRQLYASDAYWRALREKGRTLGTVAAYPFDDSAFEAWRQEALHQRASTLLHLVFHVLAGGDLVQARPADLLRAKAVMDLLAASRLEAAARQRLADELAAHYLDPDPTHVPDATRSRRRAEAVLDIDPSNARARSFVLRSVTHETGTRCQEGDRDFAGMARLLAVAERHAEALERRLEHLPQEHRTRAASDLAAYYDQCGTVRHLEGYDLVDRVNEAIKAKSWPAARRLLEIIRQAYRDSDRWCEKSLALDPVNPQATERLDYHRRQYGAIDHNLR